MLGAKQHFSWQSTEQCVRQGVLEFIPKPLVGLEHLGIESFVGLFIQIHPFRNRQL